MITNAITKLLFASRLSDNQKMTLRETHTHIHTNIDKLI